MAFRPAPHVDPEASLPDLVRRLTDDSKRLVRDEMRLAKLETADAVKRTARGALWLGLAFGAGIVALVALTVMLIALVGRLADRHYWVGALVVAVVELVLALVLVKRGLGAVKEPSYTFEESRDELRDTVRWAKDARAR